MIKTRNSFKFFTLSVAFGSLVSLTIANSSIIKIINENEDNIEINVIPEPGFDADVLCWKCIAGTQTSGYSHEASLIVPPFDPLKETRYFSVVGTTGGFLFKGKCRHLNPSKNYQIYFLNDLIGTSCISKEI